jgi:hypothetical protein
MLLIPTPPVSKLRRSGHLHDDYRVIEYTFDYIAPLVALSIPFIP